MVTFVTVLMCINLGNMFLLDLGPLFAFLRCTRIYIEVVHILYINKSYVYVNIPSGVYSLDCDLVYNSPLFCYILFNYVVTTRLNRVPDGALV